MANVSDPAIQEAYADVRNDKTDTNWLLLSYESDKGDTIVLYKSGSDGLEGFKSALSEVSAGYGFVRFMVGNDELSQRAKFVFVRFIGENCPVMRKARMSVHVNDVKKAIRDFATEVSVDSVDSLSEQEITLLVKKAMGANYDRQGSEY